MPKNIPQRRWRKRKNMLYGDEERKTVGVVVRVGVSVGIGVSVAVGGINVSVGVVVKVEVRVDIPVGKVAVIVGVKVGFCVEGVIVNVGVCVGRGVFVLIGVLGTTFGTKNCCPVEIWVELPKQFAFCNCFVVIL